MKKKKWLKYLCVFALALLITIPAVGTFQTQAATKSGSCGDKATWKFDASSGKLTISGSGEVEFTEDWLEIASDIKKVVIGDKITSIADGAFYYGLSNLKTVTIGKKCKTIGAYAFESCDSLTTVNMENSSVTSIGYSAFQSCDKLKSVTFSSKLTSIGEYAFAGCSKLKSVTLPGTLKKIGEYAFYYSGLTSITIPKKVTSIGTQAFLNCENLTAIKVSSSNTKYSSKSGVLYNKDQTKLIVYPAAKSSTYFKIPSTVTKISSHAFDGASNLEKVSILKGVTSIGSCAFYNCSSLTKIAVSSSNTKYSAKDGVLYNKAKTKLIAYPAAKTDTSFTVPSTVKLIVPNAFAYNRKLKTVVISSKVTEIGEYAFYGCKKLKTVTIGKSVNTIGDMAFACCSALKTVTFKGSAPKEIGSSIFFDATATVKYPAAKASSWTSSVRKALADGDDLTFKSYK